MLRLFCRDTNESWFSVLSRDFGKKKKNQSTTNEKRSFMHGAVHHPQNKSLRGHIKGREGLIMVNSE